MVFGWGKKKEEGKPVEQSPQEKEVQLSDVHKIMAELNQLRLNHQNIKFGERLVTL